MQPQPAREPRSLYITKPRFETGNDGTKREIPILSITTCELSSQVNDTEQTRHRSSCHHSDWLTLTVFALRNEQTDTRLSKRLRQILKTRDSKYWWWRKRHSRRGESFSVAELDVLFIHRVKERAYTALGGGNSCCTTVYKAGFQNRTFEIRIWIIQIRTIIYTK